MAQIKKTTFTLDQKLKPPPLKAIITTSEKVTSEMRQVMEKAYACPVFEEYSTVENSVFAHDCVRKRIHLNPDVGVVEIVRPDGSACGPGEEGELVATGFLHQFQIFIRYRLGDSAIWDSEPCPCGLDMPVLKEITGRIEDVVMGPDGRQMVRFHGVFVDQPHVQAGQVVQEALDRIHVNVIPSNGFGLVDVEDIKRRVMQRLGSNVKVTVAPVTHIPLTPAGKFRAIVSRLKASKLKKNTHKLRPEEDLK